MAHCLPETPRAPVLGVEEGELFGAELEAAELFGGAT